MLEIHYIFLHILHENETHQQGIQKITYHLSYQQAVTVHTVKACVSMQSPNAFPVPICEKCKATIV